MDYRRLIKRTLTEEEMKAIESLERHRIAIYFRKFKGIFNVTDWKFEEVVSYDPVAPITEEVMEYLKEKIVKFIKLVAG